MRSCNETPKNGDSRRLQPENLPIFCKSCKIQLGVLSDQTSVSLFKWQVSVKQRIDTVTKGLPNLSHCFSAMLIATMARSGCSKSIILPMKHRDQPDQNIPYEVSKPGSLLYIWVFNKNIAFSSTEEPRSPLLAVKVFYRMVSQEEADKLLDSMTSDVQDITLPIDAINKILQTLNRSNSFLPKKDRQLMDWNVGLLEKWDDRANNW